MKEYPNIIAQVSNDGISRIKLNDPNKKPAGGPTNQCGC